MIERFGGFDTWINNAGSSVWGRLGDVSDEDHQRVMQTNFWGTFYGSSIAAAHLRPRGGSIINIGSLSRWWRCPSTPATAPASTR